MKHILSVLIISLLLITTPAVGQEQQNETDISVQIRPRAEYRNGALNPRDEGDLPASFINNRARLGIEYKRSNLSMKVSGQHVGVWGQDPQVDRNGRFGLNEAWAKMTFGGDYFVQLGRQTLAYDDERILGALDWNVAGRSHDALKAGYESKSHKLHLILAFNQNEEKTTGTYYAAGGQPYKAMQTLWYQYKYNEQPFDISFLFMNLGLEAGNAVKAKTKYIQTLGTNINYGISNWKLGGVFYYQFGKTTGDVDISAWMASLNVSYNISSQWSAGIGSDYLSGNKEGGDKLMAFNPLYGTHHKFYGSMDYFYASSFVSGVNPGLWDNYLRIGYKPDSKWALSFNYHYFSIARDVTSGGEKIDKGLGSEFDLQFDYTIMKDVKLSGGYSVMAGTKSMDVVKGGSRHAWQDWGWLSININPRIFSAKW